MKKILLVNHKEAFLGRNKTLLNRAGFLILTATSTRDALRLYREQSVDLVISLLNMPGIGGDILCSSIRQDSSLKQVPCILVHYDSEAELERVSHCGANASLIKPIHPELLLEQVGRFLNIPRRRDLRKHFNAGISGTRESLAFSGTTLNVSASGLLCETRMHFKQDDLITDLLFTVGSQEIAAEVKVVRVAAGADGMYNYGLQFTSLAPDSRDAIQRFVRG